MCSIVLAQTLSRCKQTPLLPLVKSTPVMRTTVSPRATRVRVLESHRPEENKKKAKEKDAVQDADRDIANSTSGADTGYNEQNLS